MKKIMILYVTHVQEKVSPEGVPDLIRTLRSLNISTVLVASSEREVINGWLDLITHGMHQVMFMRVAYNAEMNWFESRDAPLELWRKPKSFALPILN